MINILLIFFAFTFLPFGRIMEYQRLQALLHFHISFLQSKLQEVNADSGLVMLMDSAGNVIGKSSLSLLNGKSLEDEVYTTVRDMGTLAVPVSLIPVLEKGNVSLSDTVDVGNGIYNHNGKRDQGS